MRSLLALEPDLQIIDEAKDGQEAIELTRLHRPDLVLMDVRMPKVNGLEATQTIKEELSTTKVLIVSAQEDPSLVSEAVRAGADGYLLKLSLVQEQLAAIRGCFEASLNTLEFPRTGYAGSPLSENTLLLGSSVNRGNPPGCKRRTPNFLPFYR